MCHTQLLYCVYNTQYNCVILCVIQGEGEVGDLGEQTQDESTGLLTIYEVTRAQAGPYQCTADNSIAPPASVVGQLIVRCEFCIYISSHYYLCST